jgi:hypothetical protein
MADTAIVTAINLGLIPAMRCWVSDCVWADVTEDDIPTLTDTQILRGVQHHYVGGIAQFVRDNDHLKRD